MFVVGRVLGAKGKPVDGVRLEYLVKASNGLWSMLPDFYVTGTDGVFQTCSSQYFMGDTLRIKATTHEGEAFITALPLGDHVNAVIVRVPPAP